MKNTHILPTDKPSKLRFTEFEEELIFTSNFAQLDGVNIYITSDEEIKEGDYYISILENEVYKATKETQNIMSVANLIETTTYKHSHFKIILTTDQDLIEDGVQSIDNEFLEWFVKNPSCEEVEIKSWIKTYEDGSTFDRMDYEIIIPKEEPKQDRTCTNNCSVVCGECQILEPKQETLEEVAERILHINEVGDEDMILCSTFPNTIKSMVEMAKWQQEQDKNKFNEEDILKFSELVSHNDWVYLQSKGYWVNEEAEESEEKFTTKELFNKFKKK